MRPCFETKESHAAALGVTICAGCLYPKPGVTTFDVRLQDRAPRDKPLNFVYGYAVGLMHRELLDLIGMQVVQRDLYIGRVTGARGDQLADWVTFRGRRQVIIRGSKDATYRVCPECDRVVYFASGKQYLYPAPPADAMVFGTQHAGLIVGQEVQDRVAAKKWRRLGVEKLPVLDEPLDGLGVLPFRSS